MSWHFRKLPFWERVSIYTRIDGGGCHLFDGPKDDFGYGRIRDGKKFVRVHRAVWERDHGPIPHKMVVMHKCDVRSCVNPEHLQLGTQKQNVHDRERKDRGNRMRVCDYVFGAT